VSAAGLIREYRCSFLNKISLSIFGESVGYPPGYIAAAMFGQIICRFLCGPGFYTGLTLRIGITP
jgi:hypothetical protein